MGTNINGFHLVSLRHTNLPKNNTNLQGGALKLYCNIGNQKLYYNHIKCYDHTTS